MRTLVRRLTPALVLPLLLVGVSPSQAADTDRAPLLRATTDVASSEAPSSADVTAALTKAPATLVPDTAPVSAISQDAVVSGTVTVPRDPARPVQLGLARSGLAIGLPATDADTSVVRDGVSIFQDAAAATSYAVNPLAGGSAQFLVAIGGSDSPEEHAFPIDVPAGALLTLTEDGGAQVAGADGSMLASIPAPWARDANGRAIPTHFTIVDGALVQIVEHKGSGAAYPVLADPSIFSCDAWTATCVKFTKAETVAISKYASPGVVGAFVYAGAVCGKIPVPVVAGGCALYVSVYSYLLSRSFDGAAGSGKCVEMHFSRIGAPLWWKTESC